MKLLLISLLMSLFATGNPTALTETQKIDKLINYVSTLKNATFVRNGSEYDAKRAAEHLQMKREKAGDRIKTARQFVKDIASVSSMSGEPYMIKFKDGRTYKSGALLNQYLDKLEGK